MSLVVTSNIPGMNSRRSLAVSDRQLTTSLERLSSGSRINRAADDASNLAISEGLRAQIGGIRVALRNSQDGISVLQTAEGALTESQGILHRMRDLAVQAANSGGLSDEARGNIQAEVGQLSAELDRIAGTTTFNGTTLLDGSYRTTFQVGADVGQTLDVAIGTDMSAAGLGVAGVDVRRDGRYTSSSAAGVPPPGQAGFSAAGVLTFVRPTGSADFHGAQADVSAYAGLDGVISYAGRSLDLSSVAYDATVDTDSSGTVDGDDLLAQLNDAARSALGMSVPPFASGSSDHLLQLGVPASEADLLSYTPAGAAAALGSIDAAIARISTVRGDLGAVQNRFEHNIAKLGAALDNTAASDSRIRDTDMATEMTAFSRAQILTQAGTAMLAQANSAPQTVLKLIG